MGYAGIAVRLSAGGIVILDGGTGTELERRGLTMNPEAWCGTATLDNVDVLRTVHMDYIAAGADVITANTFASSRLMLGPAGYADMLGEINRTAVRTALEAREASGSSDILVAGSLSHMVPLVAGEARSDHDRLPSTAEMADAFGELANLLHAEGCDLILLEMMYHNDRMRPAFEAATATGLPVWAGFSARSGADGSVCAFTQDHEVPFTETVKILRDFDVAAAGVMHTPSNLIADAVAIVRTEFAGPLVAYPDSGYFKMPEWQFENIIEPAALCEYARNWVTGGVQIVGGCCGLGPAHISALAPISGEASAA